MVRKNVARLLTVLNQKAKADMRKQAESLRYKPKLLREKKTRAMRRALTPAQAGKKTAAAKAKASNFPVRKFALRA